jgi:hypothetical protein
MMRLRPWQIIAIGFVLVLLGFLLPMMMEVNVLRKSLWLSFVSYGASVAGLLLGVVGAALYQRAERH